ncbi:MAG: replicative DNA helicase [Terrimicrobiaceae bacterium]
MSDPHMALPSNIDAERGLLGSMLLSADVIDSCPNMEAAAFHLPIHQVIFETLQDMRAKLKPVDLITVTAELRKRDLDGLADIESVVTDLVVFVPTAANWDHYAEIVQEAHVKRKVIAGCLRAERLARGHMGSSDDLLNEVEQTFMEMRGSGKTDDALKPVKKFVDEAVNSLEAVFKNRGKPIGLTTGFVDLDRMTGGLKPTLLYVIAGRPSMGKTVLAVQIATHNALSGVPVALYSLEMSGAELAERMIGTQSSINLQRWRDGFLEKGDLPRIAMSSNEIAKSGLWIDETPSLSIMDLRARARRAVTKRGVKLIVIDYMQLMRAPSKKADFSRAAEVADISMGLKAMAKELRVPVIVCAQLNRENDGKRPALSNLRESGQIEQDADAAILIHRPFKDKEKTEEEIEDFSSNGEPAEAILAKQRNGPIGTIDLRFFGQFTRFESTTKKAFSNNPNERQKKK